MITEQLIQEVIQFNKKKYGETTSHEDAINELTVMKAKGCLIEHACHCDTCPKYRNGCRI